MSSKLEQAAELAVTKCLMVKPDEKVLVITDVNKQTIGEALFKATEKTGAEVSMIKMKPLERDGQEPSSSLAEAMKKVDVIICVTTFSLTHTDAMKDAISEGARAATASKITEEAYARAVNVNYESMREIADKLYDAFANSHKVRIVTDSGTDVRLRIAEGRIIKKGAGIIEKGKVGNLPSGEVFIAPEEGKTNGIIVIDHMPHAKPKTKVLVRKGLVAEVEGDDEFKEKLWKFNNARNIAEFGIGCNEKAILSGTVIEDEKVLGTCHIAFGTNSSFGGNVKADIHWDAILLKPTIYFDDKKIMDSGELLL